MTDLLLKVFLPSSLAIIMLGMGMSLTIHDFTRVFRQPKAIIIGLFNQIFILPIIAFLLAILFHLDTTMAVGLIVLASCPGGPTSNIIAQVCDGNLALSVTLTAVGSFTSVISTQLVTSFALTYFNTHTGTTIELPVLDTMFQIMMITMLPICIGMFIHAYKTNFALRMLKPMKIASTIIFILIFIGIVATNFNTIGQALKKVGIVTLLLNISIIGSGFLLAKIFNLGSKNAISIGVDGSIQNATLGIVIATSILNNIEMAIPTAAYTIWMYTTGGILMWYFGKKKQKRIPSTK
ncbi:bile acid:sodium symporter family protein [Wenyingzhuangia sp. chi5]|uniref:Bile acid:sodium symporter family protein n=1 Tax=Wenyingzhuangia gilva TaxID=3057677 RepID=A0ABT8VP19_9FLAO|nr:bile acid:sodium symporter family protein [Wenyingzhuangia sp. chi5]MDO3693706.1 bile acid:sodium symporter family protein [Wenyingzhuangia sp. chi5]